MLTKTAGAGPNINRTGVLLVNTGTPTAPTKAAVVEYLRRFLMDRRIVNLPTWLWRPILEHIVLKARPNKTVKIYQSIWTSCGSPYTLASESLERALKQACAESHADRLMLSMAHRYGQPSIKTKLQEFQSANIEQLLVLPLYPQQALAVTHSVHDELQAQLEALNYRPSIDFIWDYYQDPNWISAVADSIRPHLDAAPGAQLLFSFHSVPLKDLRHGDLYKQQVEASVSAIAERLGLRQNTVGWAYQSRFDDAQRWLDPFLFDRMQAALENSYGKILIATPGFSIDCTETLHDINIAMMDKLASLYPKARERIVHIPCLNDSDRHVRALHSIIASHLSE